MIRDSCLESLPKGENPKWIVGLSLKGKTQVAKARHIMLRKLTAPSPNTLGYYSVKQPFIIVTLWALLAVFALASPTCTADEDDGGGQQDDCLPPPDGCLPLCPFFLVGEPISLDVTPLEITKASECVNPSGSGSWSATRWAQHFQINATATDNDLKQSRPQYWDENECDCLPIESDLPFETSPDDVNISWRFSGSRPNLTIPGNYILECVAQNSRNTVGCPTGRYEIKIQQIVISIIEQEPVWDFYPSADGEVADNFARIEAFSVFNEQIIQIKLFILEDYDTNPCGLEEEDEQAAARLMMHIPGKPEQVVSILSKSEFDGGNPYLIWRTPSSDEINPVINSFNLTLQFGDMRSTDDTRNDLWVRKQNWIINIYNEVEPIIEVFSIRTANLGYGVPPIIPSGYSAGGIHVVMEVRGTPPGNKNNWNGFVFTEKFLTSSFIASQWDSRFVSHMEQIQNTYRSSFIVGQNADNKFEDIHAVIASYIILAPRVTSADWLLRQSYELSDNPHINITNEFNIGHIATLQVDKVDIAGTKGKVR
jgi:hypothetical protein